MNVSSTLFGYFDQIHTRSKSSKIHVEFILTEIDRGGNFTSRDSEDPCSNAFSRFHWSNTYDATCWVRMGRNYRWFLKFISAQEDWTRPDTDEHSIPTTHTFQLEGNLREIGSGFHEETAIPSDPLDPNTNVSIKGPSARYDRSVNIVMYPHVEQPGVSTCIAIHIVGRITFNKVEIVEQVFRNRVPRNEVHPVT